MNTNDRADQLSPYAPVNPLPLGRRLKAAGLGSLAEEEQRRIDAELAKIDPEVADFLRERLTRSR